MGCCAFFAEIIKVPSVPKHANEGAYDVGNGVSSFSRAVLYVFLFYLSGSVGVVERGDGFNAILYAVNVLLFSCD